MSKIMNDEIEHYRQQFYLEALEILDTANDNLLKAEADPTNEELLNAIFRGIHTIKGSAGTFGLDDISEFAHHLEALLSALRDKLCVLTAEMTDAILHGLDVLTAMVEGSKKNKQVAIDKLVIEEIRSLIPQSTLKKTSTVSTKLFSLEAEHSMLPAEVARQFETFLQQGLIVYKIQCKYSDEIFSNGYDPLVFMTNLKEACSGYFTQSKNEEIPNLSKLNPLSLYLHPIIFVVTVLTKDEILDLAFDPALIIVEELVDSRSSRTDIRIITTASLDKQVLQEFIISSKESLNSLEQAILDFERDGASSALNDIFRTVHNIKGDANYVGLSELSPFVHDLESVLEGLKTGTFKSTKQITDIVLLSIDALKAIVHELSIDSKKIPIPNIANVINEHLAILLRSKSEKVSSDITSVNKELPESFIEQIKQYNDVLSLHRCVEPVSEKTAKIIGRALKGIRSSSAYVKCESLQTIAKRALSQFEQQQYSLLVKSIDEIRAFIRGMTEERKRIGEILIEEGKVNAEDVERALAEQYSIGQILIAQGKISEEDVKSAVHKQDLMELGRQLRPEIEEKQSEIRTMRVDESKIERFANLLGEMVIARNTYEYIIGQMITQDLASSDRLKPLKENLHLFSRVTNEMQSDIMAMRMIPIKTIFTKFQRVVRDIGRKQNKDIDLVFNGEDTEVDKKVADMLSEPLVHMIRNSCDHGIESKIQRVKAGKTERGTIILSASQEGRNIIIKIIDDGQGLDRNRIYQKALKMGLSPCLPQNDQIFQFIFHPGLSTKSEVSDLSGRGVGMDVVRSTISSLGGEISVNSEQGKGTVITLTLPMAIGISTALTISSSGQQYAIPFDYVLETVKVQPQQIHRTTGGQIIHYRGKIVTIEHLTDYLGSLGERTQDNIYENPDSEKNDISLVMLKTSRGMFGIIVDKLGRNLEIAIKPVPPQLAHVQMVSGVSILGDGKVVLVLNPEKLHMSKSWVMAG